MTDEEKKQAAIDLLVSKRYPRIVAEAIVKISGAEKVLATVPDPYVPETKTAGAPKPNDTHAEDCGDVGETGDHGELGENAKA